MSQDHIFKKYTNSRGFYSFWGMIEILDSSFSPDCRQAGVSGIRSPISRLQSPDFGLQSSLPGQITLQTHDGDSTMWTKEHITFICYLFLSSIRVAKWENVSISAAKNRILFVNTQTLLVIKPMQKVLNIEFNSPEPLHSLFPQSQ